MLAYQLHGENDLRLEEIAEAEVGPGDVRVRVVYNGICGTDLHFLYMPGELPRPLDIGHEISGVVAEVGADVTDVAVGDRVAVYPIISCGDCGQCKDGYPVHCERYDRAVSTVGCGAPAGGLAQNLVVPSREVVPLPADVTLAQGAMVEPLAVAYSAVERASLATTDTVVVLGAGPIGIGAALAAQAMGAAQIIVVEPSEARREAVSSVVGDATVLDPRTDDVVGTVRELTGGRGADVVIECAAVQATVDSWTPLVRKRGMVVLIGLFEKPVSFQPNGIALADVHVIGHNGSYPSAFHSVIAHMRDGGFRTDSWVTEVPWDAVVTEGFEPLRRGERIKVLVRVADDA